MKQVLNTTDLDFNFLANPFTGDISTKTGVDAIKQSVKNILFLNKFEKPFNFDLDAGLKNYLFELFDPILGNEIKKDITNILKKYEPRINVTDTNIVFDEADQSLNMTLTFYIIDEKEILQQIILKVEKTR